MTDADQPKEFKAHGPEHNSSPRHAYDEPNLSPKEFLLAVMRSQHLPLTIRIKAAEGAAPYFTPRPGEARHYPCVDAHLTYVIPDNPALREACEPTTPDQTPPTEGHEQNNENSQSFSWSALNSHQPQLDDPRPLNTETNSSPQTFIDYSTPLTPAEIQQVKAAIQRLHPDADLSQLPDHLTLCECGHWVPFPCKCARIH